MSSLGDIRGSSAKNNIANSFYTYSIDIKYLIADNATIDNATIDTATINNLTVDSLTVNSLTVGDLIVSDLAVTDTISILGTGMADVTSMPFYGGYTTHQVFIASSAIGVNDIFTVPSGFKMIPMAFGFYNTTASPVTYFSIFTRAATAYTLTTPASASTHTRSSISAPRLCFMAGDTWSISTSTAGSTITASYYLFPDTIPLTTYAALFTTSSSTLVQLPSTAGIVYYGLTAGNPWAIGEVVVFNTNTSGSSVTQTLQYTPNGGSQVTMALITAANPSGSLTLLSTVLGPGDNLSILSSSSMAVQGAVVTLYAQSK